MKCPRCKSDNITYSHRRGVEKILRYIWPWYVPYRCKECWTRFWVHERKPAFMIILGLVVLLLIALITGLIILTKPSDRKSASKTDGGSITAGDEKRSIADQNPLELPEKPAEKKPEENITAPEENSITEEDLLLKPDIKPEEKAPLQKESELLPKEIAIPAEKADKKPEKEPSAAKPEPPPEKKPEPAASKEQTFVRLLKGIEPKYSDGELKMTIRADSPISEYKVINLDNPRRIVVNLKGKWKSKVKNELNIESGIIRRIRIGEHSDKSDPYLSIVMDAEPDVSLKPKFEESSEGLILILGK